jgi:hypothetical protein
MEGSAPPSPPAPPAPSKKNLWIIIGVIVIVIVLISSFFILMGGDGNGDGDSSPMAGDMAVGDFFKWEGVLDFGEGDQIWIIWMNVTAVDSTGYDISYTEYSTAYLSDWYINDTGHINKTALISRTGELPGGTVGQTNISTEFGSRTVNDYHWEFLDQTGDQYFGVNNNVMYKHIVTEGNIHEELYLVDSNIDWV